MFFKKILLLVNNFQQTGIAYMQKKRYLCSRFGKKSKDRFAKRQI